MKDKKFISVIDFYSKNVEGMLEKQNYHVLPVKLAQEMGYDAELWVLSPNHENAGNLPKEIKVRTFDSTWKYMWALLRNDNSIIYANTRIWKTMACSLFGCHTIFMSHTTELPENKWHRFLLKLVLPLFDSIRAVNIQEKKNLEDLGVFKVKEIPHSIDLGFWKNTENPSKFEKPTAITVANVRAVKNIPIIQKACKKAGVELIIIGENMGEEEIETVGHLPPEKIRENLHRAHVYVNSSSSEGMCISVYEAAAAGLPLCLPRLNTFKGLIARFHDHPDSEELAENIKQQIDDPIYQNVFEFSYDAFKGHFKNMLEELK